MRCSGSLLSICITCGLQREVFVLETGIYHIEIVQIYMSSYGTIIDAMEFLRAVEFNFESLGRRTFFEPASSIYACYLKS